MKTNNLAILNTFFKCQYFELNADINVYNQFESHYKKQTQDYKYGLGIIESDTKEIFVLGLANDIENDLLFKNQLSLMPSLTLHNVLMLLALVKSKQPETLNPFEIPTNYPSDFAMELLKETNGYIIFSYQLMQLLSCCLPLDENNVTQINEYKRHYNCRSAFFFNKLETLYLPDGYCLADLLLKYTVIGNSENAYGFVCNPMYASAYQFIQKSKKYLTA